MLAWLAWRSILARAEEDAVLLARLLADSAGVSEQIALEAEKAAWRADAGGSLSRRPARRSRPRARVPKRAGAAAPAADHRRPHRPGRDLDPRSSAATWTCRRWTRSTRRWREEFGFAGLRRWRRARGSRRRRRHRADPPRRRRSQLRLCRRAAPRPVPPWSRMTLDLPCASLRDRLGLRRLIDTLLGGGTVEAIWIFDDAQSDHWPSARPMISDQPLPDESRARQPGDARRAGGDAPGGRRASASPCRSSTATGFPAGAALVALADDAAAHRDPDLLRLCPGAQRRAAGAGPGCDDRDRAAPVEPDHATDRRGPGGRAAQVRSRRSLRPLLARRDEFGRLARVFQGMAVELLGRERELDQLVQERTAELQHKTDELYGDLRRRSTQELTPAQALQRGDPAAALPATAPELVWPRADGAGAPARRRLLRRPRAAGRRGIGVLIADVSGKGVPAAFFMGISRTVLRATRPGGPLAGRVPRPGQQRAVRHQPDGPVRHRLLRHPRPAATAPSSTPMAATTRRCSGAATRTSRRRWSRHRQPGARDAAGHPLWRALGEARTGRPRAALHGRDHRGPERSGRGVLGGSADPCRRRERRRRTRCDRGAGDREAARLHPRRCRSPTISPAWFCAMPGRGPRSAPSACPLRSLPRSRSRPAWPDARR